MVKLRNSSDASASAMTGFATVAAPNTATGRHPASRSEVTLNSSPIETNAAIRNQVRSSFTAEMVSLPAEASATLFR